MMMLRTGLLQIQERTQVRKKYMVRILQGKKKLYHDDISGTSRGLTSMQQFCTPSHLQPDIILISFFLYPIYTKYNHVIINVCNTGYIRSVNLWNTSVWSVFTCLSCKLTHNEYLLKLSELKASFLVGSIFVLQGKVHLQFPYSLKWCGSYNFNISTKQ